MREELRKRLETIFLKLEEVDVDLELGYIHQPNDVAEYAKELYQETEDSSFSEEDENFILSFSFEGVFHKHYNDSEQYTFTVWKHNETGTLLAYWKHYSSWGADPGIDMNKVIFVEEIKSWKICK